MRPSATMPARPYRLPTAGELAVGAVWQGVLYGLLFLGWPYFASQALGQFGIAFPFPFGTVLLFGLLLAALAIAAYVARPSRAAGPVAAGYDLAILAYLYWLAQSSSLALAYQSFTIALGVRAVFLLFMVPPAVRLVADLLTTAEDAFRPTERYPFDFPA